MFCALGLSFGALMGFLTTSDLQVYCILVAISITIAGLAMSFHWSAKAQEVERVLVCDRCGVEAAYECQHSLLNSYCLIYRKDFKRKKFERFLGWSGGSWKLNAKLAFWFIMFLMSLSLFSYTFYNLVCFLLRLGGYPNASV